jgi:hypothetical protein
MLVYLTLLVTAAFTPFRRCLILFVLTAYFIYCDVDVLLNIPFFTGALLADLSLVLNSKAQTLPSWNIPTPVTSFRLKSILLHHWPIILAFLALFIGSYPPDSPELAPWSQFLFEIAQFIFPATCIFLSSDDS